MTNHCENCHEPIEQPATGRPRKWCSDRCRRQGTPTTRVAPVGVEPVAPAVEAMLEDLDPPATDPRAVAAVLLRQLAAALDANPGNVGIARELRQLLVFVVSLGEGGIAGELSAERLRFLRGRVDAAINARSGSGR